MALSLALSQCTRTRSGRRDSLSIRRPIWMAFLPPPPPGTAWGNCLGVSHPRGVECSELFPLLPCQQFS